MHTRVVTVAAPSANRKLAPVEMRPNTTDRLRPVPVGPFVASTMLPIRQTCSDTCRFKSGGCMATGGFTGGAVRQLERNADGLTPLAIIEAEVAAIDDTWRASTGSVGSGSHRWHGIPQRGGRDGLQGVDLRLHIAGDIPGTPVAGTRAAWLLAGAAKRWKARGGGRVFAFTHSWRAVAREDWGSVSVLASIEDPRDGDHARARGYAPAIVVDRFPGDGAFVLGGTRYTPCPAETRKATCVSCRLCIDRADWMRDEGRGIAFAVHGPTAETARRKLPVLS